jgi:hypothetical protein
MRIEGDGTVKVANKLLLPEGNTGVVLKTESGEIEILTTEGLRDMIYQTIQLPCVAENPSGMPDWQREVGKLYTGHPICRTAVGVNTSHPQADLHVTGDVILGDISWINSQPTVRINAKENKALLINSVHEDDFSYSVLNKVNNNTTKAFAVEQTAYNNAETFVVYGDGTTVIGAGTGNVVTPSNNSKLAVYGLISANEVLVTLEDFPDYVFEEDYCMDELDDVAEYIKENKHLPGVVSAKEVKEKGGFELGAVQLMTLEKLEELYLYVIQLNERIKLLEQENTLLKSKK